MYYVYWKDNENRIEVSLPFYYKFMAKFTAFRLKHKKNIVFVTVQEEGNLTEEFNDLFKDIFD